MTDTPQRSETTAGDRPDRESGTGRFLPGNPGRPKGARHAALVALEAIGQDHAENVLRKAIELAEAGDVRAIEIILRRFLPERKGRPVAFSLPELRTAEDPVRATSAIAAAVAAGDLTPEEAQAVAAVVETHRRSVETADLEKRLAALEAKQR
jgi:hypothetical protein